MGDELPASGRRARAGAGRWTRIDEGAMNDPLHAYPVVIEAPVAWGQMDAYDHVNNTVYFRWFESARIAYLDRIGFRDIDAHGGVGPILASTRCRFRRALAYPDTVRIGARATAVGEDRFTHEYAVVSEAAGGVAAEGAGVIVAYDYGGGAKAAIPDAVREAIERLEGRSVVG
ncbi:MAG: acyl-CoA thioesterase [Gemmatimonadota bacterium]